MALQITIIKAPVGVPLSEESKTFTELGGTIGRGAGNSWVLSDPERFLSSRHCEISCEAGQYFLTDLSTNGTFVNDSPEPIGKGGRVLLHDGDVFELGDYRFALKVQQGTGAAPFGSASPFDFGDMGETPSANRSPFGSDDVFSSSLDPGPDQSGLGYPSLDHAGLDHAGLDHSGLDHSGLDPLPLSPIADETDPLAAFDKMSGAGGSGFGESFNDAHQFPHSHHDGAGALNEFVQWPESTQQNVIPEDWEDDFLGGGSSLTASPAVDPLAAPPLAANPVTANPVTANPLKVQSSHRSLPLTDPPVIPQQNTGSSLDDWLANGEAPFAGGASPVTDAPPSPVKGRAHGEPMAPTGTPPVSSQAPPAQEVNLSQKAKSARSPSASSAGMRLVESMGLGSRGLTEQQIEEIAEVVGELVPEIVEGMMQVLRSRASIKNEFRMNITTIQPVENNPLKFSVDTSEALENMFVRKSSAYKKPKEAFREGFNGIAEHQVALIAGIRAAFKSMMERFDPEHLEKQFDRQTKGAILPGMQKARYWSSYTDYYRNFVDNLEQSFQYLFGDEFVQAYEDQLRKLVAARKRNVKTENNKRGNND